MPPHHLPPDVPHRHGSHFPGRAPGLVLPGQAPPAPPELLERRPGTAQPRESPGAGRAPRRGRRRAGAALLRALPPAAGAAPAAPAATDRHTDRHTDRDTRHPRVLEGSGAALFPGPVLAPAGLRRPPPPPGLRRGDPAGLGTLRRPGLAARTMSPGTQDPPAVLAAVPRPRAAVPVPAQPLVPGAAPAQPPQRGQPRATDFWEKLLQEVPQGLAVQEGPEGELRQDRGEPQLPDPLLPALLHLCSRGRIPDPAEAGGVCHCGHRRCLPGGRAAAGGRGAGAARGAGGAQQGRGGAAGAVRAGALAGRGRARGHGAGAAHRPPLPLGAGSLLHLLAGAVLPAHLRHAAQEPGHAQVQPAGAVPGRRAGCVFQGPHPAAFPGIPRLLDGLLQLPGSLRLPGSPDPAGDFLPLLRGLHLPGGDPAPDRHQLPALRDHPEHVALLADPGGGRARAASPGPFPVPGAAFPAEGDHQQARAVHRHLPALPHQRPGGRHGRRVARGHLRPLQRRPPVPAGHQPAAPRRGDLRPRVPHLLPLPEGGGQPVPPAAQGLLLPAAPARPARAAGTAPGHTAGGRPPADASQASGSGKSADPADPGALVGGLHAPAQPLSDRFPKNRAGRSHSQRCPARRSQALNSRESHPISHVPSPAAPAGISGASLTLSQPLDSLRGFIPKSVPSHSRGPEVTALSPAWMELSRSQYPKNILGFTPATSPVLSSFSSRGQFPGNWERSSEGFPAGRRNSQPPGITPGAPHGRKFPFPASPFPIPAPFGLRIHPWDVLFPDF
ncbi:receptor for retinol uptake STRA6 isoform X1 [Motacilla alba alba]|uniref:receptor for retinol uptake STRA6 isoform X1 n=1 Tax=Motacilla alba alba TaxID=1094192 RepID=UPI0018D51BE6|nr:receptor for retinol uptake STRA6 isoform X1 [Motacilla alba alba]